MRNVFVLLITLAALVGLPQVALADPPAATPQGHRLFSAEEDGDPDPGHGSRMRTRMRLVYTRENGAESCPAEDVYKTAVAGEVRWQPFAPSAPWTLTVVLRKAKGGGYEGSAVLVDVTGHEELRREYPATVACLDLVKDLATAVSIHVDPPAVPGQPRAEVPPEAAPEQSKSTRPRRRRAKTAPPAGPKVRVSATAWGDLATAPRPAFGASLGLGVGYKWFSADLEAHWTPPAGSEVSTGVDATTSRFTGALVPCGHASWFVGCLVGQFGTYHATLSRGPQGTQAVMWGGGGVRVGVEIQVVDHLAIRAAVDVLGASSVSLRLNGGEKWASGGIVGSGGLGAVVSW